MTTRRELVAALCVLSAGLVNAQSPERTIKPVRAGLLAPGNRSSVESGNIKTFVDAMRELGWIEGGNIIYDRLYADRDNSKLEILATEMVSRAPDVIWTTATAPALAVLAKTRTIPIVFSNATNVVEQGLAKSLARPGGNATGLQNINTDLGGKRLQLFKHALPKATRIGVLTNPSLSSTLELKVIEKAAVTLGLTLVSTMAKTNEDFHSAIAILMQNKVEALLVTQAPVFFGERKGILEAAAKRKLPVMGFRSEFAEEGALMSYSALISDQIRRSAQMVDKVLKGTKPADIPIEQPTTFHLVINIKTAKLMGITIPPEIMLQATKVIE